MATTINSPALLTDFIGRAIAYGNAAKAADDATQTADDALDASTRAAHLVVGSGVKVSELITELSAKGKGSAGFAKLPLKNNMMQYHVLTGQFLAIGGEMGTFAGRYGDVPVTATVAHALIAWLYTNGQTKLMKPILNGAEEGSRAATFAKLEALRQAAQKGDGNAPKTLAEKLAIMAETIEKVSADSAKWDAETREAFGKIGAAYTAALKTVNGAK